MSGSTAGRVCSQLQMSAMSSTETSSGREFLHDASRLTVLGDHALDVEAGLGDGRADDAFAHLAVADLTAVGDVEFGAAQRIGRGADGVFRHRTRRR